MKKTTTTTISESNQEKRLERKKSSGEDFTPLSLSQQLSDKLEEYSPETFSTGIYTVLDPSCGNGQLLIPVLQKRLNNGVNPIQALDSLYGLDIFQNNINECRLRLLKVIVKYIKSKGKKVHKEDFLELIKIVSSRFVYLSLDKYPQGTLSLDNNDLSPDSKLFNKKISDEQAKKTLNKIIQCKLLDKVEI